MHKCLVSDLADIRNGQIYVCVVRPSKIYAQQDYMKYGLQLLRVLRVLRLCDRMEVF